jgi:hypothetical protein
MFLLLLPDASIVLTEDTDSFIIGDRVWVGGTKPGQIAYIGETQFAPGEWAGVVLDEPVGQFLKIVMSTVLKFHSLPKIAFLYIVMRIPNPHSF